MQTNPEQWADKVLDDVIVAWSEHGHSAGIEAIQAAFAEQNARLVGALEQIKHSAGQARIPGNDWKRELALIENTTLAALKDRTQ